MKYLASARGMTGPAMDDEDTAIAELVGIFLKQSRRFKMCRVSGGRLLDGGLFSHSMGDSVKTFTWKEAKNIRGTL